MKGNYIKKGAIFFTLLFISLLFLFNVNALIAYPEASNNLNIQLCILENNSVNKNNYNTSCVGVYPSTCSTNDELGCDDTKEETASYTPNKFAGVYIQVGNTSINNCGSVGDVFLCYKWKTSAGNFRDCMVAVDANGNANWTNISTACPGTSEPASATCVNVTSNESWTCSNFFGTSGTKAVARNEISRSNGPPLNTLSTNVLFFNVSWYVETVKPSGINLINPANQTVNSSRGWTFSSNASDNVGLANATLYTNISGNWVKNQTNTTIGSGNITTFTINNVQDGGYIWNVQWCDTSNNCAQANSNDTFTVNNPPTSVNLISPLNNLLSGTTAHNFFSNASDDRQLANSTLYHNIDGIFTANQTVNVNGTFNTSSFTVANIADGTYIWNVQWCDTDGNCSFSINANNFTFTVDSTRPSSVNLTNPADNTNNASTSHIFESNASDAFGLISATLYENINGIWDQNQTKTVSGTNGVVASFNISNIINGIYVWNVEWCDGAGNCNQSDNNFTFTVDTTSPSSINLISPANNTENSSTNWQFESNASDNIQLVNATLYTNISGSWIKNQTNVVTGSDGVVTSFNISNVADGGYIWNVEWCDGAGNCNQSDNNFTFTVNNPPDGINFLNPPDNTNNASTNHYFISSAADNRSLANATLYTNISGSWNADQTTDLTGTTNTTNFAVYNIASGGYSWNVKWCDADGSCTQGLSNQTLIVNFGPNATLNNPPDTTLNISDNHQFNGNYSDDRGLANATLYTNISGSWNADQTVDLTGVSNFTSFTITGITSGAYNWNIEVCDSDNVCSQALVNFTFTMNLAPSDINLINPSDGTFNESDNYIFESNASDDRGLANATLYTNISGNWNADQIVTVSGNSAVTQISFSNITDGTYVWNVEWCDTDNYCAQSVANFTFTVNATSNNSSNNSTNSSNSNNTSSNSNNSTQNNSTSNSTSNSSSGGAGSGSGTTPSGGVDSEERARKLAVAQAAQSSRKAPSAPASNPAPSPAPAAPAPSSAAITGAASSIPTGNFIKESGTKTNIENKIVANVIIWSIIALILVFVVYIGQMYLKRKALKGRIKK